MTQKPREITKAVIACAGYETRFLPATKNQPKQMLPIIDKPIIHYLVEEAVASGIKDIILITQAGQHSIEDYFDSHFEMETILEEKHKTECLEMIRAIPQMANFIYVRQNKGLPYGNGTPITIVKNLIDDDEAFVYMFGDDMTISKNGVPVTKQLIDAYEQHHPAAVLAVQEVSPNVIHKYASIRYKENPTIPYEMEEGLEKVSKEEAPSNMVQFGRFVFSYDVIDAALETPIGRGNELWTIDILNQLTKVGEKVMALPIDGEWVTTGDPQTFLQTTLKFAMLREDLAEELKDFIRKEIIN